MDPNKSLAQELQALETVPDSYIVVSPELIILTASDAYLRDTLKRREELVGRYLFDAFPDNPAAPNAHAVRNWRASLERVIATGQPHQMALQHYDVLDPERPGHFVERHWKPLNTPVFDAQGKLRYIIHSSVNVTEEVLSRRALRISQDREHDALAEAERERQRLSHLVMQAPAAICLHSGPELVYEFVNPSYQQLFPGKGLVGKPLLEVVPELQGTPIWQQLQEVYQTGRSQQRHDVCIQLVRPADSEPSDAYFNYTFQPRYNEHQQVDGVYVFAFEVTEQVLARQQVQALNQELNQTNQQLTRVNADLDSFVYMAAHDLRGPINNLEGLVQALHDSLPTPPAETSVVLNMMRDAVTRFQRTLVQLNDVLQLHQAHDPTAPPTELATVVDDLRQDLLPALQQTGGTLEVDADACPLVAMPAKSLRSMLYNLLSNAIKYRHPDRPPHVRLNCHTQDGLWHLTVQDNGLGLTDTQQASLFALFRRFHNHVEGSGLGLYTVKKIVENLGGRVEVQSELGVGSTFSVYIPS
ncbi:PAS domain-containing protein [Hymenobacter sediminis]|uniref:sensor histidine kinase n=1 Tax=Hymenobacter sediminis TaxID=2218621 RepID=UPI000DA66A30|nr:PAS domain-containing sensor histidine kinase [Hymenobacter sediminis]RPD47898.1 PAS domain-containing protein [Hymenobacter sediminis]